MAELQQAATAYQKKAGTEWGLSIQPKNLDTVQSFYQFLYSAGGEIVSRTARPSSTDPNRRQGPGELRQLLQEGSERESVAPGYGVTKDFNSGSVPMFFSGPWMMGLIDDNYPDLKGKWGVANVPTDGDPPPPWPAAPPGHLRGQRGTRPPQKELVKNLTGHRGPGRLGSKRTKDLPANVSAWKSRRGSPPTRT
ncbi:hypothetical protein [Streptomyces sp. KL116D]|uniref:hypothetical protein n=1 Tax=Streptomyces sp. KL116D TaxID=3045152 RepID=UPI0035578621